MKNKRGQVWVETVIYTLIGLAIIGIVLAGAMPKINQRKDELAIDQSIEVMGIIDNKIYEVQRAVGNRRIVSLDIRKGYFVVNMEEDSIYWVLDSSFQYSESGVPVSIGKMNVTTTGEENPFMVELRFSYPMDLRYAEENSGIKRLDAAPTPYNLIIENYGKEDGKVIVNFNDN